MFSENSRFHMYIVHDSFNLVVDKVLSLEGTFQLLEVAA